MMVAIKHHFRCWRIWQSFLPWRGNLILKLCCLSGLFTCIPLEAIKCHLGEPYLVELEKLAKYVEEQKETEK